MKEKQQGVNPFLPSYEYIPDGEPHVFGERLYLFGSHDKFGGEAFCMNDYVCYSAAESNLREWRFEGTIYCKKQDPRNSAEKYNMYAPDVVKGTDGKFYLYYCLEPFPQIAVAVCDEPAGKYEFLGFVKYQDGTVLGEREGDCIQFDPGIFIDDDQEIYLFSGNAPRKDTDTALKNSQVMRLKKDMLTLKTEPEALLPSIRNSVGTGFEGHEFFEASSARKINGVYYLIYSSVNSHELCYAVSEKPDRDYRYGGTIISIGDIFYNGREAKDALNYIGNTHGGIECVKGKWYVFYHRQTNRTQFSRQACAEEIEILNDGEIPQVEMTSCGLNGEPLRSKGQYDAYIACNLRGKNGARFSHPMALSDIDPYFTQEGGDREETPNQYIRNMTDGAVAGFKYFDIKGVNRIGVSVRGNGEGKICVKKTLTGESIGEIEIRAIQEWKEFEGEVRITNEVTGLDFEYNGTGYIDFRFFEFI